MANPLNLTVVALDIAEPIYAVGEVGATFRQVKWKNSPPAYAEESDYWVLIEQDGAAKGIVYCNDSQYLGSAADEPLVDGIEQINPTQFIAATTPLMELLKFFASRGEGRYFLLDGGRVTHWLEDWHLSRTPVRLALLGTCLELEAALEAFILLSPNSYIDDQLRRELRSRVKDWGYERDDSSVLVRCASFSQKWHLVRERTDIFEALNFMSNAAVETMMTEAAKLRNGLAHGHAVLPLCPFASTRQPIPGEQHRRAAGSLVGLLHVIEQMTSSLRLYVRRHTPKWFGGDLELSGGAPPS